MLTYDRQKAVNYARRWSESMNPQYPCACGESGDSTNFVSQCLYMGCGTESAEWRCNDNSCTPAWIDPQKLRTYLISPKEKGPCAAEVYPWALEPGDIVQVKSADGYWRTMVVMSNQAGNVQVAAHSYQSGSRPLDSYRGEVRCYHILGVLGS